MYTYTYICGIMDSIFVETFGKTAFIKVLDFFLTYQNFDYSKSQVAEEVGISRVTMEKIWKILIKREIIKKTRVIGRATLYRLNKENPVVKALIDLDFKISSLHAHRESEKLIEV